MFVNPVADSRAPCRRFRDGRVVKFTSAYKAAAFKLIDAQLDFIAVEQNFSAPGLFSGDDTNRSMSFRVDTAAGERIVIDVVYRPPVTDIRARAYVTLVNDRAAFGIDRLDVWLDEKVRSSLAFRNAVTIQQALLPDRYYLNEDVALAVLEAARANGGRAPLGWLSAQPGLGRRPQAAIFSLALTRRLLFVDKTKLVYDDFVLALPEVLA